MPVTQPLRDFAQVTKHWNREAFRSYNLLLHMQQKVV